MQAGIIRQQRAPSSTGSYYNWETKIYGQPITSLLMSILKLIQDCLQVLLLSNS